MAPSSPPGSIAFVPPRFGVDVVGGSEAVMREAATGLARRGWRVEVLTTCARDHYTWANELPPGRSETDDVTLHRFPVVRGEDPVDQAALEHRLQTGASLSAAEQIRWVNGLFRVPDLYHHLLGHAADFDALVFSPYLFWTTIAGVDVAPQRSIVMPCLHDEPYATVDVVRAAIASARGQWYLSEPERDLAGRRGMLAEHAAVVGAGVEVPDRYQPERAREALGTARRFVLYAGRREGGKGWDDLVAAWVAAVDRGADIDLVTMGVGAAEVPERCRVQFHDLGFVDDADAPDYFAAAAAYVQPSRNESFSRTIMESWLAGTPVLANAASDVVAWHCERSGAGLVWSGRAELTAALELVAGMEPTQLDALAAGGRPYVLDHYRWTTVLDAMEASLEAFTCAG